MEPRVDKVLPLKGEIQVEARAARVLLPKVGVQGADRVESKVERVRLLPKALVPLEVQREHPVAPWPEVVTRTH